MENISKNFYSKKNINAISKNVEKRLKFIKCNPLPDKLAATVLGESQIFKIFNRQAPAIEFCQNIGLGLKVFAYEGKAIGEGGKRNFVVCHPRVLWRNIKDRPVSYRCTYEVIPEGCICKLYFDLEFPKDLNPEIDGNNLTKTLISLVNYYIWKEFEILCEEKNVLDLDSSTKSKFSKHLIYNCDGLFFANNGHVGRFINMICNDITNMIKGENLIPEIPNISKIDIEKLFINTSSSKKIFCDLGVYTKNRNFRTYQCSKFGKNYPLIISSSNKYIPEKPDDENFFLDSLITNVPINVKMLTFGETCMRPMSCNKPSFGNMKFNSPHSPYPEIENYINNYLGGLNLIKDWRYFAENELLVFEIDKKHRFCNNIGREHKSNSVMYVVNLRQGLFYQKCYDPDCKDYKSNEMPLPLDTMPWKLLDQSSPMKEENLPFLESVEKAEQKKTSNNESNSLNYNNFSKDLCSNALPPHCILNCKELCTSEPFNRENITKEPLPSSWNHLSQISPLNRSDLEIDESQNISNLLTCETNTNNSLPSPWNNLSQISSPSKSDFNSQGHSTISLDESMIRLDSKRRFTELSDDEILKITNIVEENICN